MIIYMEEYPILLCCHFQKNVEKMEKYTKKLNNKSRVTKDALKSIMKMRRFKNLFTRGKKEYQKLQEYKKETHKKNKAER